jgi:AcrR family transcriptional regulator
MAGTAEDLPVTQTQDPRNRRWENTHQRIYEVALKLFEEQGFEQVSVTQIASAAGVTGPTFYAHYPSKEHIVMQLPTAEEMQLLIATQPPDRPLAERLRNAAPMWFASWSPEYREALLTRWRIIATTPSLRTRAADFERQTAGLVAQATSGPGSTLSAADQIVINAHLAAFTMGMLEWAESDGTEDLAKVVDAAFAAVQGMGATRS